MKGRPVVTVGGPHGTGKSTYARALANALQLRYVCAGQIFRELARENKMSLESFSHYAASNQQVDTTIDERTKAEAAKGSVVIDAQLGAWMVKQADVKLLLFASNDVRFARIAHRDRVSYEHARDETLAREKIQKARYLQYYGIDVEDLSIYTLRIDTGLYTIDKTKKIIIEAVRIFLQ
jgi:cytidylate kinase